MSRSYKVNCLAMGATPQQREVCDTRRAGLGECVMLGALRRSAN